ncbi:M28 family metallopeptidase [Rhodoflexus sp.]
MLYLKIAAVFLCIGCTTGAFAQDMERVRRNIGLLCSPELAGRGYTRNADRKAAQLIADAFRAAGAQPLGNNYFQPFPVTVNTFPKKMDLAINRKKLQVGVDFIPNPVSGKGAGNARLIQLDTLLARGDSAALSRAMQTDYRGKAIAFRMSDYYQILEKCPELIPEINKAKVWLGTTPTLTAHISGQALQPPFLFLNPEKLGSAGQKVRFRIDSKLKTNYSTQNVIAYIKGSQNPDQFVVFTAHYDHLGTIGSQAYIPGANDNAAGVAMLIELAHYFQENPPPFSVALMAFSGEELGLLGAQHYVANPLFPLRHIRFLWNLDLIGTGKDGATVVNANIHSKAFEQLKSTNDKLQALPKIVPRAPAANSDHYPFSAKGVPAFFIYLMDKEYPHYHNIYDKAEALPLDGFSGLFRLLTTSVTKD